MSERKPVVVFLPCHSGSTRIEEKNTRPFGGSSLTEIKLNQLVSAKRIDKIYVFTDDQKITEICKRINSEKIVVKEDARPDVKNNDGLIAHFANKIDFDGHLIWTHVTSPFLGPEKYDEAITMYLENLGEYDSLVSVNELHEYIWDAEGNPVSYNKEKEGLWPKTQTIAPLYKIDSGMFILPSIYMKESKSRVGKKVLYFKCSEIESIDLDWPEDFERANLLWDIIKKESN